MPRQRTAYEILGLPRNAAGSAIRGRYREFARRIQPESGVEYLLQDPKFRLVARSYVLLMSPDRKEYDRQLRQAHATGEEVPLPDPLAKLARYDLLMLLAETALLRKQYGQALQGAKDATGLQPRQPEGWALIGDIMKEQRKWDDAIAAYNYAIQMAPEDQRYWRLLTEATDLKAGHRPAARAGGEETEEPTAAVWLGLLLCFIFVELSMLWVRQHPGEAVFFDVPSRVLVVAVADGLLLGLVLAANDLLGRFEDVLVYYTVPWLGVGYVPLGVFGALPGLICFWLAPLMYAVTAYLDATLSFSLVAVMACSALILGMLASLQVAPPMPLLLLGGNFVFGGMLLGWALGSARRRLWKRGD